MTEKERDMQMQNFEFLFGSGAQFIVSKERIHQRPREFYMKIVNLLNSEQFLYLCNNCPK